MLQAHYPGYNNTRKQYSVQSHNMNTISFSHNTAFINIILICFPCEAYQNKNISELFSTENAKNIKHIVVQIVFLDSTSINT